jgi:hypothetical protein
MQIALHYLQTLLIYHAFHASCTYGCPPQTLPSRCNWRDSSCATLMFFGLEGCTELVFLALRLEFIGLLFSDKIFGIFNHSSNIRVWSDQLSYVIYTRPSPDLVSRAQRATFKGIRYPSLTKILFLLCREWYCSLVSTRSYLMLELILPN